MTTVHFCYRVTADRLERIEEDGLPPSIRPSQPPPGLVILHAQMPGSEVIDDRAAFLLAAGLPRPLGVGI